MTSPRLGVAAELLRAAADLALLPPRAAAYVARRGRLRREARADLAAAATVDPGPAELAFPERPLTLFLSCAEASGELHAVRLARALRGLARQAGAPPPRLVGLGGRALAAEGVELVGEPVSRAAMGFDVVSALPYYLGLLRDAAEHFGASSPDLFLPIDSPALHVPLARLARASGVPTVHFVTPQYWGWAPWRVGGYRRAVDLALAILPFEEPWFERHGVPCATVGHPLLDSLPPVDLAAPREPATLALLPGSRRHVVERNLPWMLARVAELAEGRPELRVLLPQVDPATAGHCRHEVRRARAEAFVEVCEGGLHETLARASSAFSVSGTVLLDLLAHRLPTVVVYRLATARQELLYRHFLTVPWFSSPNLLSGDGVLPEFCFHGEGPVREVGEALVRCYNDPGWRDECRAGLDRAAARLGPPGATERAARHALGHVL